MVNIVNLLSEMVSQFPICTYILFSAGAFYEVDNKFCMTGDKLYQTIFPYTIMRAETICFITSRPINTTDNTFVTGIKTLKVNKQCNSFWKVYNNRGHFVPKTWGFSKKSPVEHLEGSF